MKFSAPATAVFLSLLVGSDAAGTCSSATGKCDTESSVNLMQLGVATKNGIERMAQVSNADKPSQCTELHNKGAWIGVHLEIGTPGQKFLAVADTGSNALLVPDCRCALDGGGCSPEDHCFNGTNSKSFKMTVKYNKTTHQKMVRGGYMSYGSGAIEVVTASDYVMVPDFKNASGIKSWMKEGVMLIEDRNMLNVGPNFDGILGLGLPQTKIQAPMFTTLSSITKYTLCIGDKVGALNFNVKSFPKSMTNIGSMHWGLDLQGMSIGLESTAFPATPLICSPNSKKKGQQTACGAIPDSGTTLLMGPKDHIHKIGGAFCDSWPRCQSYAKKYLQNIPWWVDQNAAKAKAGAHAFHSLLERCSTWFHNNATHPSHKQLDAELPSLFIRVAGSDGIPQQLEIKPSEFIVETNKEVLKVVRGKLFGKIDVEAEVDTGKTMKVCMPAFGTQEYNTANNGPVWILGLPLFQTHVVGFDLTKNGAVSIDKGPCTACGGAASLLSTDGATHAEQRGLRHIDEIRAPGFDLSQGL